MFAPSGHIRDVRKIAILRANGVGDFLFILPALEAMHTAYPHAEIVLLANAWHAGFLAGRPGPVDRVIVVPPSRGISRAPDFAEDAAELASFFGAMAQEGFDLAIQLHGGGRYSNPFVRRLGARMTLGLRTPDAAPLDRWVPYILEQPEVLRYLEVVALAGARAAALEPQIALTGADLAEACAIVPAGDRPLVVLHPGAGDPRRRWPPGNFAAVGDALAAAGAQVAVIGTEVERPVVEAVVGAMRSDALDLCARLSLGGLTGLFRRCRVLVSNDSGPLHLARAVGAATVGIYWCFNLLTAGPVTRARHRTAIAWRLTCPVCGSDCTRERVPCDHAVSFVADVPVQEVIASARELFAADGTR